MNDLLRKNNDQPTNIDVSCVQTVGLKHAKGLFVLLETNFFTLYPYPYTTYMYMYMKNVTYIHVQV
jgi:hypothetical protein